MSLNESLGAKFAHIIEVLDVFETAGAIRGYSTAYNTGAEIDEPSYFYFIVTDNQGQQHKMSRSEVAAFIIGIETSPGGMGGRV